MLLHCNDKLVISFKDLDNQIIIKGSYRSIRGDNLVKDFYNPLLSNAKTYKRISCYYSSKTLGLAARGIATFVKNESKMKLIIGKKISEKDYEAATKENFSEKETEWNLNIDDLISDDLSEKNKEIEKQFAQNHLKTLSYMVDKGILEIKIAMSATKEDRLFHEKSGVMEDKDGNKISFSGSQNETYKGWSKNVEQFVVQKSWNKQEKWTSRDKTTTDNLKEDEDTFDLLWNNNLPGYIVLPLPEIAKEKLILYKPEQNKLKETISDTESDFETKTDEMGITGMGGMKLRKYQEEAIDEWSKNKHKGIYEMATGSGKTFTAIQTLQELSITKQVTLVIIAVPTKDLCEQWPRDRTII